MPEKYFLLHWNKNEYICFWNLQCCILIKYHSLSSDVWSSEDRIHILCGKATLKKHSLPSKRRALVDNKTNINKRHHKQLKKMRTQGVTVLEVSNKSLSNLIPGSRVHRHDELSPSSYPTARHCCIRKHTTTQIGTR